ncbi:MAG: sensor histidine kinase [Bilophila wadsworthia]
MLAVAVFHDISEIARLMRVRKEFVANVSHELRTPLTAIAGYAETLRDSAAEDPSICAKFAETILRNAQHMGTMVEDLLKLSRIESGAVPMEMETVKAASILSDVTTACQPQTAAHNLTLETDIDPALTVRADPHFIGQVFRNLIENACRYAPKAPPSGFRQEAPRPQRAAGSAVHDMRRRPGIPQADIARVFERFYRVEKHRSSPASTGLGLAICKHRRAPRRADLAEPGPGCLHHASPRCGNGKKDVRALLQEGPSPKSNATRRLRPQKRKEGRPASLPASNRTLLF